MECPRCKEEIVVGRVCPVCGYVVEDDASTQSSRQLTDEMEVMLNQIKSFPDVTLKSVFSNYMTWLLPLLAIGFLCMSLISEAGLFWILFAITAIMSVWKIFSFIRKSGRDEMHEFETMVNNMETFIRIARRDYSHSSEMIIVIQDFENQVHEVAKMREASRRSARLVSTLISVVIVIVVFLCVFGINLLVA